MADLAKVLKGLEHCMMESDGIQDNPCADCPYLSKPGCSARLKQDAINLLKSKQAEIERLNERVPKKGEWLQTDKPDITAAWHPHCSVCGKEVTNHYAFCPFCGTDMRDSYEYISNMT